MSEIGRCFGLNLFEIFCENLRYFEISTNGRKYCRCRMGDHQVRVFAHHWKLAAQMVTSTPSENRSITHSHVGKIMSHVMQEIDQLLT